MFNPRTDFERDEEAGLPDDTETLIEEPLEGEATARKDVEVRDPSRIVVQRLGSIRSFSREIPVMRIVSNEQPASSSSSSLIKDPESLVELSSIPNNSSSSDNNAQDSNAASSSAANGKGIETEADQPSTSVDQPSTSSFPREEAELPQNADTKGPTFKRPEIADLKLPQSPSLNLARTPSKQPDEESDDDESPRETAEEVDKLMASPSLGTVLGRAKARLQEPPPLTSAVKDQIADSLLLRRASLPHNAEVAPEEASLSAGEKKPTTPGAKKPPTPGSFKSPNSPTVLAKQPSVPPHPEEEDPLEDTIIPEYKEKLKRDESFFWLVSQWICFILLVTLLICSVNIEVVRNITWLGCNIWRWQAVALVIFSGRLIAGWLVQVFVLLIEKRFLLKKRVLYFVYGLRKSVKNSIWLALVITIWETVFIEREHSNALRVITKLLWCLFTICTSWMLKVLAVKVAANGFHRAAYFERIQDCLFNQFLLATLSAPPTMQITSDPGGEELITSRYNPHGSPHRMRRQMSKIVAGQQEASETAEQSPRFHTPIIARSANPIEQDKLQQLTSENVSAWTLKSLMKLIRKKNLASYASTFSKDEAEWEIDSEVRAKAAAKQIFYNIARPGRKYLMLRDFLYFLPEEKATRAFGLFETTESGTITKKAFVKWVVNVYKERRALALTLNDNKTVVAKLHKVLNTVLGVVLIIVSLLIVGVETARLLVFFSSIFIPCVFIFGNAARTTFEALIFLFVLHPYDVGDRVSIDGTMMLVEEMNVLNTVFLGPTNEKIYYPNAILGTKFITNYYRSPDQWDGIEFQIHMNTPLEKLGALKERMQRYVDSQPQFWYPDFGLMCKDIDDCNKMKMGYYFQHHLNYHEAGERYKRRSNMLLYMKQQLQDLEITYQLPSQEVIVTGIPAFSFPPSSGKSSPGLHFCVPMKRERDEDAVDDSRGGRRQETEVRRDCPYLDTVNRQVLDFDFEKFCSVSLSNLNVYACLVCGKYFQGRGRKSHAYTHSLEAGHHVFINLHTEKVYCLPDGYEVDDPSLDDIRHVLNPRFTESQVVQLDKNKQWARALDGSDYLPGMVGLNNIKETDFVNVIIQSLMRVTPLRDFFLIPENYRRFNSPLVHRFGELTRKIWHARNFKGQVSPHEFLQAVMSASKKKFRIGIQSDPVEFISWLLNTLHNDLGGGKMRNSSIIYECFQGELEVLKELQGDPNRGEVSQLPFLMLGLDLPPPPLFKDVMEKNIIPQVPLFNILKKFDGETATEVVRPQLARMRYRVTRLPKYLILHMRRFTKNNFFIEKNPTLVNFPVKNLELKDYIPLPNPNGSGKSRSKYDLIANVVHDGKPGEGSYRVFVQRKSEEIWYEMQDLHVVETLPQMVALSEAYMQIYEQQR